MTGPIQIKRPDVAADIRTLADLTGLSITDAIAIAVRSQLAVEKSRADDKLRHRRKDAEKALAELRRLPVVGPMVSDEDLYDADGLPEMNIVADASALLAILLGEPDADQHLSRLLTARTVWISPINWWEVQARMSARYGEAGEASAARWMTQVGIVVEPVTLRHAELALAAYARYRGRPARLNMGDCFAYALARAKDAPLLYKGNDFAKTDLRAV